MSKKSDSPGTLSEAIARLESATEAKTKDFKNILNKDFQEVLSALNEFKPHLKEIRGHLEGEVSKRKDEVEQKVRNNPWVTIGVIGVLAFILGWLLSGKSTSEDGKSE